MSEKNLGRLFLALTIMAAVFTGISLWILDNFVCTFIGIGLFIFNAIVTLCIDKRYKNLILELLDLF